MIKELTKICIACKKEKSLNDFSDNKFNKDGKQYKCKDCIKTYNKQYRENNKEQLKQKRKDKRKETKQYYEDNKKHFKQYHKDNKEHRKRYNEDNKEHIKKQSKEYRNNNKEHIQQYSKQYRENNKEYYKEYSKEYYKKDTNITEYESELRDYTELNFNNMNFNLNKLTVIEKEYSLPIGTIDLLLKDDYNNFYIVEFKRNRSSDKIVGQLQRYMGYMRKEITSNNVYGLIVMKEINNKIKYSASENKNIKMYEYDIIDLTFKVNEVYL